MRFSKYLTVLKSIGLSESEAKVYLAALSAGPTTILTLSRTTGIRRTSVYTIVEGLITKNLMRLELSGFKNRYVAEDPEYLESMLEDKKRDFKKILPELEGLQELPAGESLVKFYRGLPALKSVYDNLLEVVRPGDDYLVISDATKFFDIDRDYFTEEYIKKRAKLPIKTRLLLQDSAEAREVQKFERNYNEKVKILPPGMVVPASVIVVPSELVITQLTPPQMTIVITNRAMIEVQRSMFEMLWSSL